MRARWLWMKRGAFSMALASVSIASCSSHHTSSAGGSAGQAAGAAGKTSSGDGGHAGGVSGGSGGAHSGSATTPEGGAGTNGGALGDAAAPSMTDEAGAAGAVQQPVCPGHAAGDVGGPCQSDHGCDSTPGANDGTCISPSLGYSGWPSEGYCVGGAFSTCRDTCQAAACSAGDVCVDWAGCKACLPACCDGGVCGGNLVCAGSVGDIKFGAQVCVPGKLGVGLHSPCSDFGDCGPGLTCVATQERPGGECTKGCSPGNDATCPADGRCVDDPVYPFCAKTCQSENDCRGGEGYACVDRGGSVGKVCQHALVGDPCANDADCGGGSWHCQTGAAFPGGYCTFTGCPTPTSEAGCSALSTICFEPPAGTNYCVDLCGDIGAQSSCRAGYTCRDVDPSPVFTAGGCVPL